MKTKEVYKYYTALEKKKVSLFVKRVFDIICSMVMLVVLAPFFLILAVAIKVDSKGPVFYRQVRVTQYAREFRIFKFRTMVQGADTGTQVTLNNDSRITRIGKFIRRWRLDEVCQLIDVLRGTMTFVGTRPEIPKYVKEYTPEMYATLLLPAGITSMASIYYKDEARYLNHAEDCDKVYVEKILVEKMKFNLKAIETFSLGSDIVIMVRTVFAVFGRNFEEKSEESNE